MYNRQNNIIVHYCIERLSVRLPFCASLFTEIIKKPYNESVGFVFACKWCLGMAAVERRGGVGAKNKHSKTQNFKMIKFIRCATESRCGTEYNFSFSVEGKSYVAVSKVFHLSGKDEKDGKEFCDARMTVVQTSAIKCKKNLKEHLSDLKKLWNVNNQHNRWQPTQPLKINTTAENKLNH